MSSVHTPAYQYLLSRLRDARREAGVTQAELAHRLGKRQAYVSRCELGERRLDVIETLEWANALGRPLDYFLPPSSTDAAPSHGTSGRTTTRDRERR